MSVAIAIALYNGEKFIIDQLDCLKNQTLQADRVVLIDDGSKDNTVKMVQEYIEKNNLTGKWEIIQNEKNLGYIKNFYKAISLCDQDYVFLSDQDDIWDLEKIEKMTEIIQSNQEMNLLSCRYGIIDSEGNQLKSLLDKNEEQDYSLSQVHVDDIMRAYRWPGMVMCIRNSFYKEIVDLIRNEPIPHDLAFAILAANQHSFYEYNYVGAYHRRHSNNVAREEHRITKLLNLNRKLKDINEMIQTMKFVQEAKLPVSEQNAAILEYKLNYLLKRKEYLENKKLFGIIQLYVKDKFKMCRMVSFVCDVWLVLFGRR